MRPPYECEHGRMAGQCSLCELDAVTAERDRLAEALRYYAEGRHVYVSRASVGDWDTEGFGKRARAALAQEADRG